MKRFWPFMLLTLFAISLAGGCLRPQPQVHFYVLASPPDQSLAGVTSRGGPRVGILPVTLPGYLQRAQMVLRQDDSVDIRMEDYHRWGENLDQGIARVLSVAMTNSLADVRGVAMPLRSGAPVDLRVQVDVRRFEGQPGGSVFLEALWSVQKERAAVREGHFLRKAAAGPDLASMVEALSSLLVELGEELAAGAQVVATQEEARAGSNRN